MFEEAHLAFNYATVRGVLGVARWQSNRRQRRRASSSSTKLRIISAPIPDVAVEQQHSECLAIVTRVDKAITVVSQRPGEGLRIGGGAAAGVLVYRRVSCNIKGLVALVVA
ncbi:MAG: hypothetical protein P4M07_19965 [Xanthobacteraceae bacterium]|nr:hypothetical protein [Xanthobacteraceae bacterium]